ncbi:hypothetical protein [Streptosporangium vulgare]|uniref:hypothetical protein n=1 Tax=Streptosporangium vulgare TaxID=46190 RepID=UPI0031CE6D41
MAGSLMRAQEIATKAVHSAAHPAEDRVRAAPRRRPRRRDGTGDEQPQLHPVRQGDRHRQRDQHRGPGEQCRPDRPSTPRGPPGDQHRRRGDEADHRHERRMAARRACHGRPRPYEGAVEVEDRGDGGVRGDDREHRQHDTQRRPGGPPEIAVLPRRGLG